MSNSNLIEIGCFVGVHGIKGEVKVKSYAEKPENIFTYEQIFIDNDINPIKLKLVRKVKQNLICKIENVKNIQEKVIELHKMRTRTPRQHIISSSEGIESSHRNKTLPPSQRSSQHHHICKDKEAVDDADEG